MGVEDVKGGEKGDEQKELPFEEVRDPVWATAIDGWPWLPRGEIGSEKMGKCPRCGHPVTFVDTTMIYAEFATPRQITGMSRRYASCGCSVPHPGAPAGQVGCGANGLIERPAE
jgi:hypothetical protein